MKRRKFIILTGLGATSATMLSACGHPENKLIPALIADDEYVPGLDYRKASTCAMCAAGCGIVVRTREHKANKIEGNPLHPVNRGALCARGQAGLQTLYNPDRICSPLKRAGERGSGEFVEITWDEAIKTLAEKLREIKAQDRHSIYYATGQPRGVNGLAGLEFNSKHGQITLISTPVFGEISTVAGYAKSYDRFGTPTFDIANATYLISFGARFLETWFSPVMYSLAYGEFRRTSGKARGKFVHIEPRMSLTAANADEWLPATPGTEDLVALAISQVIAREKLREPFSPELASALEEYAPEKTASLTDIPAEKIARIAREFASSERPLAIAGQSALSPINDELNPAKSDFISRVNLLNAIAGNWNKPGGLILPSSKSFNPLEQQYPNNHGSYAPLRFLQTGLANNEVSILMFHQVNPIHFIPEMRDRISSVPFIASFSSFMDETTQLADLILPDHTYLESWDIQSADVIKAGAVATITRPVVAPEFNTRQTADVLIALSRELGQPLSFESAEAMVKQAGSELMKNRGSISAENPEDFVEKFIEQGLWAEEAEKQTADDINPAMELLKAKTLADLVSLKSQPIREGSVKNDEYPFTLLTYEHAMLGFGEQANLPWLQELPDPMTTVMWGSWVEINPKTAAALGIADGDLIEVATAHGSVQAPAVVYPAIRPDVIAIPFGQGHTGFGRYASGRGANAALLNPRGSIADQAAIVSARVSKIEGEAKLIRFGTELLERIETNRPR
jgi:anaerobic selenocysteine-containing dehydrogenase